MSRSLQLVLAAVSALALGTVAAPLSGASAFETGPHAGSAIGSWCC
jgi:hypothetical protein